VIDPPFHGAVERGSDDAGHESVKQDGNRPDTAFGDHSGQHGMFCATQPAKDLQGRRLSDPFDCGCNRLALSRETVAVETGPWTDKRRRITSEEACRNGCGRGRVADPHLPHGNDVGTNLANGAPPQVDEMSEPFDRKCIIDNDVGGRRANSGIDQSERHSKLGGHDRRRRRSRLDRINDCSRDFLGKRGDTALDDTVIPCRQHQDRSFHRRNVGALPSRQPRRHMIEAGKGAGRAQHP
jgi:hypothetical protein